MRTFKWQTASSDKGNGAKIKAIKQAAPSLIVVARTDARAQEGLDAAIKRSEAYIEAGADAIFPEALQAENEFRQFAERIPVPLLANMTEFGKTPYYRADEFEDMGFHMVIYPVTSLRAAAKACERMFGLMKEHGSQKKDFMICRHEKNCTIRFLIMTMKR